MSKSVTVPTNKGNPVVVYCNGKKYIYTAGETVTVGIVPDHESRITVLEGAASGGGTDGGSGGGDTEPTT